ncbi:MAG: hypothetical protein UY01_C0025G0002 [Candidatus Nomurabacteria bacterium GW2011_GWB1_47_6]|uniref:Uncharacterized protein n=1 Tax=Candidatus Nomurabacteria bacterium GW2011_GWB1_47_6 TaxID=1618749 RepID=A0A0G1SZI6_9BACT|nr:MAG: hypothetical protein UY01_C0025G0002 [Candidatus Nomurabacteria bacterium GW2011_GWB1_47_6]
MGWDIQDLTQTLNVQLKLMVVGVIGVKEALNAGIPECKLALVQIHLRKTEGHIVPVPLLKHIPTQHVQLIIHPWT